MYKELIVEGLIIPYCVLVSKRARSVRVIIKPGGDVLVTLPQHAKTLLLDTFLSEHKEWILKKWKILSKCPKVVGDRESRILYENHKEIARKLVSERILFFNTYYRFRFGTISIRNQKTRWGSCSKKGNLNFNYKVALLSQDLADYIVVHELCHLKEFNHGEDFWRLVESTIPDYRERRGLLKKEGLLL